MQTNTPVTIYKHTPEGQKFFVLKARIDYPDGIVYLDLKMPKDTRNLLDQEMAERNINFPVTVELLNPDEDGKNADYNLATETYTNKKGEEHTKDVLWIENYQSLKPFERITRDIRSLVKAKQHYPLSISPDSP